MVYGLWFTVYDGLRIQDSGFRVYQRGKVTLQTVKQCQEEPLVAGPASSTWHQKIVNKHLEHFNPLPAPNHRIHSAARYLTLVETPSARDMKKPS